MARITLGDQLAHAERERDALKADLEHERQARAALQHEITTLRMRIDVATQILADTPQRQQLTEGGG